MISLRWVINTKQLHPTRTLFNLLNTHQKLIQAHKGKILQIETEGRRHTTLRNRRPGGQLKFNQQTHVSPSCDWPSWSCVYQHTILHMVTPWWIYVNENLNPMGGLEAKKSATHISHNVYVSYRNALCLFVWISLKNQARVGPWWLRCALATLRLRLSLLLPPMRV